MQLKKIELQGFKSFADKTEIVFPEGITTIVGPNGSGKSNISDALRWVLGEQSIKTLRGAKMEDVIFAGTQARKKVGFAEVSMYLDNTDSSLPIDYNEVVVTRRIYRSGESNYLLNGSECRLKDIQELFMDTGVGKDGYSIISQGKIDEILSTKSEERRHIFEEASGIVKYRTRKEEATRKLNNTENTLTRVNDILTEIENIIGPLEKKSETAKKYLLLRDKLKQFDVKIFIDSLTKNAMNLSNLDDIIETFSKDIGLEEQTAVELERGKLNLKERFEEIILKLEESKEKYFELENESEKLNSKINVSNSQIENFSESILRLNEEIDEDKEKIDILKEELKTRDLKSESMLKNKVKFEEELKEKQTKLDLVTSKLDSQGVHIEKIKEEVENLNEEKYELKVKESSMLARVESNDEQIDEKNKNVDKVISGKDSISAQKNDIYLELTKKNNDLEKIQNKLNSESEILNSLTKDLSSYEVEENKLKQENMVLTSKYNYLKNLDKENEGYFKSVKQVLEYSKEKNIDGIYGTIASIISTDEKYEYAIEIALGGFMQNIVTSNSAIAKEMISYLKQNSYGRATFLPLDSIKEYGNNNIKMSNYQGFIGMATDLVKFDKKYIKAINLSLSNTAIIDNIDNAIQISKQIKNGIKLVTLQGELISTNGSMTGGNALHKSAGLIGRAQKQENIKKEIEKKQEQLNGFNAKLDVIKKKKQELKTNIDELKLQKDELSIEVATYSEKYENIQKEVQRQEKLNENYKKVLEDLIKENNELKNKINEINEKIKEIDEIVIKKEEEVEEYTRFNKQNQEEINFLTEDVVNLKISLSSFDESVLSINEMKEKINQDIFNFETLINKRINQIENLNLSIVENKKQIQEKQEKIKEQVNFKEEYNKISEDLRQDKIECSKKQDVLEVKVLESIKKIEKLKEEKLKVESRKIKFDIEIENLKNKMWDEYELTISSAKQILESMPEVDEEEKDVLKTADKIRKEIKDLGEINIASIEEYQTTRERYDFIFAQKKDLDETKAKLQNLINNMTSIMKQQFATQFKIIAENFNETFKELFGGGKAELRLSDENNLLESGIDIEVQPPGKKLQSMMLLSGGERALTATALLFAILKIKSPPFCILDEIEAALDDVNVHRFAEYIKKYSGDTQFIVITHRKGTMEVASSVYGVTMEEYGISKVISMKLK
jgi:chromosome segregation protein